MTPDLLARYGQIPLPPYIRKGRADDADRERYQTVYAQQTGAVAAPTAGLHFTPGVFEDLKQRGIDWAFVTLHVGIGTFQPIQVADVTQHQVHARMGRTAGGDGRGDHDMQGARRPCRRGRHHVGARAGNGRGVGTVAGVAR